MHWQRTFATRKAPPSLHSCLTSTSSSSSTPTILQASRYNSNTIPDFVLEKTWKDFAGATVMSLQGGFGSFVYMSWMPSCHRLATCGSPSHTLTSAQMDELSMVSSSPCLVDMLSW